MNGARKHRDERISWTRQERYWVYKQVAKIFGPSFLYLLQLKGGGLAEPVTKDSANNNRSHERSVQTSRRKDFLGTRETLLRVKTSGKDNWTIFSPLVAT